MSRRSAGSATPRGRDTHGCPDLDCDAQVPRRHFACPRDWARLPDEHRDAINNSYGRDFTAHMLAMAGAVEWYAANPRGTATQ